MKFFFEARKNAQMYEALEYDTALNDCTDFEKKKIQFT